VTTGPDEQGLRTNDTDKISLFYTTKSFFGMKFVGANNDNIKAKLGYIVVRSEA